MIRSFVALTAASALASLPLYGIGCGGKSSAGASGNDGGPTTDAAADVTQHLDSGKDTGNSNNNDSGGTIPEGGLGPSGTQLVVSPNVQLNGVTSDGYAVYTDLSASTYNAVPLAGGTPTMLGSSDGTAEFASGAVAFAFTNPDMNTGASTMTIWSSAHGPQTIGTAVFPAQGTGTGLLDLSSDGTHVLYLDNITATTGDISVVNTDGTGKTVLLPGADLTNQSCPPSMFFAGSYAVIQYCPTGDAGAAAGDGGVATNAVIKTFTGATWTTTGTIASASTPGLGVDPTGANIEYISATGLQVAPVATGTSALIDAQGALGAFTSDGMHLIYTVGGAVNLASIAGGTPTPLVAAGGYTGIAAVSPDNNWLLAFKTTSQDNMGDTLLDLYLASASKSSTPTTLASTATAALFGDPFTADSTHAVFTASVNAGSGTLTSVATSGGSPATLGSSIWINNSTTAAKVVFNANYMSGGGGGGNGQADIMTVDASTTTAAALLVTQADANYFLDKAKDKVVYSWSYLQDGTAGIWVTPLP